MNSQQNVLQVLVSNVNAGSNSTTVAALPDGELGFFDKANAVAVSGEGRFVLNSGGTFIESNYIDFAGWDIKAYAAPVLRVETITIPTITVGKLYMIQIILDIKGMTGKYIKHGAYKAKTGDDATAVATALAGSLNKAIAREGNTAVVVTTSTDTVIITGALQTYIEGKKLGFQVPFTASLSSPEESATASVVSPVGTNGVGTGNYVHAKEYLAWGNQDSFRYNSFRNNFTPKTLSDPALTYGVQAVNDDVYQKTAHADVRTSLQVLLAFEVGTAPAV